MTLDYTMTLYEQFQSAPMTSAERLGALIDAATRYQHLNCKIQNIIDEKDKAEREAGFVPLADLIDADCDTFDRRYFQSLKVPLIRNLSDELDSAIEAEGQAQAEVSAWVVTLLGGGTLGDCRSFLNNRAQYQGFVAKQKQERTRPNDRPKQTALWARFFGQRKAAPPPSSTR